MVTSDLFQAAIETRADLVRHGAMPVADLRRELVAWLAVSRAAHRRVAALVARGDLGGAVELLGGTHDAFTFDDLP